MNTLGSVLNREQDSLPGIDELIERLSDEHRQVLGQDALFMLELESQLD